MSRKAIYAGCLTGVAVVAALFYPLFVVLPGAYGADWQTGSEGVGLMLALVAAAVVVGGGALAAYGVFVLGAVTILFSMSFASGISRLRAAGLAPQLQRD